MNKNVRAEFSRTLFKKTSADDDRQFPNGMLISKNEVHKIAKHIKAQLKGESRETLLIL